MRRRRSSDSSSRQVGDAAVVGVDANGKRSSSTRGAGPARRQGPASRRAGSRRPGDVSRSGSGPPPRHRGRWCRTRDPSSSGRASGRGEPRPGAGPRDRARRREYADGQARRRWGIVVTLSNPYTSRATTLAAITGLILVMAAVAFLVAVLVAAFLAHRFTTPLTRLTEAVAPARRRRPRVARRVRRAVLGHARAPGAELQFNTMADRLEQSVDIIRRDRDYSRDFVADVSHELRTPIAAMKMFVELLQGLRAGTRRRGRSSSTRRPAARPARLAGPEPARALEAGLAAWCCSTCARRTSGGRSSRPWSSSGRPPSARASRSPPASPIAPLRIRHDPPRVGQIVSNLVANAIKFTRPAATSASWRRPRTTAAPGSRSWTRAWAWQPAELPRIFERFYRGSEANEARCTAPGWASRSSSRSWTCTTGRSRWRAGAGRLAVRGGAAQDPRDVSSGAPRRTARGHGGRRPGRRRNPKGGRFFTDRRPAAQPGSGTLGRPRPPTAPIAHPDEREDRSTP